MKRESRKKFCVRVMAVSGALIFFVITYLTVLSASGDEIQEVRGIDLNSITEMPVLAKSVGAELKRQVRQAENEVKEVLESVPEVEVVPDPEPEGIKVLSREGIQDITPDEYELFARCVMAESGGESWYGQYMVAEVILNRAADPDYPDTVYGVITQRYQFTTWHNGMISGAEPTESVYSAVDAAIVSQELPADVIFFSSEGYQSYGVPYMKYKNHYFSRKK